MGRKSDARDRIIQTAWGLFRDKGYGGVGVQEICEVAGVKKGSFYHFFPSKRDLVLAFIEMAEGMFMGMFEHVGASGRPYVEQIRMIFEMDAGACREDVEQAGRVLGCPVGNLALELAASDDEVRERLAGVFHSMAGGFEGLIKSALEAGEITGVDPKPAARSIVAYFEGVTMLAKTRNEPEVVDMLAYGALALIGVHPGGGSGERALAGRSAD